MALSPEMITMHAGMEKAPTTFYKGPLASRAIFSVRGLSPLRPLSAGVSVFRSQHHDFEQLVRPSRVSNQTYPSVLIHMLKPIYVFQRGSLRNTINMTPLCNFLLKSFMMLNCYIKKVWWRKRTFFSVLLKITKLRFIFD